MMTTRTYQSRQTPDQNHSTPQRSRRRRRAVLSAACAAGSFAAAALMVNVNTARAGVPLFWDADGTAPVNGGDGNWNFALTTNWAVDSAGSAYQAWNNANGDIAVFGGTAGTISIANGTNVTAGGLQFDVTGYNLNGLTNGSITLVGPATVNVAGSNSAFAGFFSGSAGLNKIGTGTLVLVGANNYTGDTNVTAGALQVSLSNVLPAGNALTLNSPVGAALIVGSSTNSITSLTMTGLTSITGNGKLNITGSGSVTISGSALNGAPGSPAVQGATMVFTNNPTFDVAAGGTAYNNAPVNMLVNTATTTFTKQGAGTLNFDPQASNSFSKIVVNSGTLGIVIDRNLGATPAGAVADAVTLNGGAIRVTSNVWSAGGASPATRGWTIGANGGTLDVAQSSGVPSLDFPITGTGKLTKTGITTILVTNPNNNFSGGLLITQGRWNAQATGVSGTGAITLAPAGTATANFGIGGTNVGANVLVPNDIVLQPNGSTAGQGTVSFEINNSTPTQNVMTLGGVISGTSDLVKGRVAATTGVLAITNAANAYTGSTQVLLGTLRTAANSVGLPSTSNLILNGGAFETSGNFTRALGTGGTQVQLPGGASGFSAFGGPLSVDIAGDGSGTGPQLVWGGATFNPTSLVLNGTSANDTVTLKNNVDLAGVGRTIQANAALAVASGVLGNGSLTKSGAGVLQLTGNNTYAGSTNVTGGALRIAAGSPGLPTASNLVLNGGVFETSGNFTRALGTGAGQVQLPGGANSGSGFSAFGGPLTVDIGGDGSGTGPTLAWASTTFNPTTLILNAATANDTIALKNNIALGASLSNTIQVNAGTATVSGVLSNTGSLTKSGAGGVLVLSGANTYTGSTSVIGGTLSVSSDANLGAATGSIIFSNGATLRTAGNVTSARNVSLGTGTLGGTIDTAGNDSSFSGVVSGSGALNKVGAGTLRLTGTNTMTGTTTLSAGTVVLGKNAFAPVLTNAGGADVKQGRLVFDYSGGGTDPATQVQSILTTGRPVNFATGKIRSSTADASKGLGWVDDTTAQNVTVGYVYYGDSNVDGKVDLSDFTFLAANFNKQGAATWNQGDFNYDGNVDLSDFTFLASNFNQSLPVGADGSVAGLGTLVPEPTSVLSVGMLAGSLVLRRRRRA